MNLRVVDFDFEYTAIEAFTCGDCWALAWELAKLGYEPIMFLWNENEEHWSHFAVYKDGFAIDIEGVHDLEKMEKVWGKSIRGEQAQNKLASAPKDTIEAMYDFLDPAYYAACIDQKVKELMC